MTDIKEYQFKYFDPTTMTLTEATYHLRDLRYNQKTHMNSLNANLEMKSQAAADLKGITRWVNYDRARDCQKVKHYAGSVFIKTELGWEHMCCTTLPRLPNTYVQPSVEEVEAMYVGKETELELIRSHRQKEATAKTIATKKAMAEAAALLPPSPKLLAKIAAKAAALQAKADLKTEALANKAQVRIDRLAVKQMEREFLMSPEQIIKSRQRAASKARCKARNKAMSSQ